MYARDKNSGGDKGTRYTAVYANLNEDPADEVIVYVTGDGWCGSGGCTTLVLAPVKGTTFRVVTKITIAQLPMRLLFTKTNGWRDIGVWVQGGGIQPGYEAQLSFDGETYPENPSVPPARRLGTKAPGDAILTSTANEKALYQ